MRFENFSGLLMGGGGGGGGGYVMTTLNLIKSQSAIVQDGLFSSPTPIYSCATVKQLH